MSKSNAARRQFGNSSSSFPRPDRPPCTRCNWRGCQVLMIDEDLPLCREHAMHVFGEVRRRYAESAPTGYEPPQRDPFVYYLMIAPYTVKIGTTRALRQRIDSLRTDLQYVVAVERGAFDVERQRHRQFAAERIGLRENFQLSPRLKQHIETLHDSRDEMLAEALA